MLRKAILGVVVAQTQCNWAGDVVIPNGQLLVYHLTYFCLKCSQVGGLYITRLTDFAILEIVITYTVIRTDAHLGGLTLQRSIECLICADGRSTKISIGHLVPSAIIPLINMHGTAEIINAYSLILTFVLQIECTWFVQIINHELSILAVGEIPSAVPFILLGLNIQIVFTRCIRVPDDYCFFRTYRHIFVSVCINSACLTGCQNGLSRTYYLQLVGIDDLYHRFVR